GAAGASPRSRMVQHTASATRGRALVRCRGRRPGNPRSPPPPSIRRRIPRPRAMTAADDLSTLMARVALRDRAAFAGMYRATSAHLLGVAFRMLNNRERAEEVLQEAFVNVWNGAHGYNPHVAT